MIQNLDQRGHAHPTAMRLAQFAWNAGDVFERLKRAQVGGGGGPGLAFAEPLAALCTPVAESSPADAAILSATMRHLGLKEGDEDISVALPRAARALLTTDVLGQMYGSQWVHVIDLCHRAARLTEPQAKALAAARDRVTREFAAEQLAMQRVRDSRGGGPFQSNQESHSSPLISTVLGLGAKSPGAQAADKHLRLPKDVDFAVVNAAEALAVRDKVGEAGMLTQDDYDLLTYPWATTMGRLHPIDRDRVA